MADEKKECKCEECEVCAEIGIFAKLIGLLKIKEFPKSYVSTAAVVLYLLSKYFGM